LNTTDGQRLSVETDEFRQTAESGARGDAAKVIGASAIGAIIGAVAGGGTGAGVGAGVGGAVGGGGVLLTRGKPVTLPAETLVTFHLSAPISITERLSF
jgi:hypothetical protein